MFLNIFGAYYSSGQKVLEKQGDLGEVWISGYQFAHNLQQLQKNNIFAICSGVDLNFQYPSKFQHLKFDLDDSHLQDARHTFEPAFDFIEKMRKKTNVLVHCAAGISRCSTLLIAYTIKKYGWGFQQSLQIIRKARPCCQPNMGFSKQLKEYQIIMKKQQKQIGK